MFEKKTTLALAAVCLTFGGAAAQAQPLTTIGTIPAQALSAEQMKAVEGKDHVYNLIESLGVELPGDAETKAARTLAAGVTTFTAAPKPQNGIDTGNSPTFVRSPSRDAAAFVNALGTPLTPTRK